MFSSVRKCLPYPFPFFSIYFSLFPARKNDQEPSLFGLGAILFLFFLKLFFLSYFLRRAIPENRRNNSNKHPKSLAKIDVPRVHFESLDYSQKFSD